jgi:hypothetical protein
MGRFPFRLTGGGYVLRPSPLRWTSVESASSAGANYRTAEVGRRAPARPPRSSHSSAAAASRAAPRVFQSRARRTLVRPPEEASFRERGGLEDAGVPWRTG